MLVRLIPLAEFPAVIANVPQGLMQVQAVVGHVDDASGDVRAVVRRALQIGQQVQPRKARADGALLFLQAEDSATPETLQRMLLNLFVLGQMVFLQEECF